VPVAPVPRHAPLTDGQWAHLVEHGHCIDETGAWRQHYDPKLALPFKDGFAEPAVLWPLWDAIACSTLVLRGTDSDILTAEMLARKPGTRLVEFPGIGHAPMLMSADQIATVREWLLEG
jgi:pimeloyl-ACP methyl ester carboxylesterase